MQNCDDNILRNFTHFQKFEEEYACEIKLNDEFNNYVKNFEQAYWGPNTAKHQVHSPYDHGGEDILFCYIANFV